MATGDIVRVRYAGKDFPSAYDELVQRAKEKFAADFNDFYTSGVGGMLIDLFAYVVDGLSFYTDRQATDTYLATSILRKAVSKLTRQLGYKMDGAIASSVDLTVTLTSGPYLFDVVIPKGFQFKGPNGLIFESTQAVTYSAGQTVKTVSVREGQTKVEIFTSNGTPNQVFGLAQVPSGKYVASAAVTTYVAGVEWTESDFITFDQTNQYEIGYSDEPPSVRFGDGVAGNIPAQGAEVRVVYVITSGKAGQATSGSINDVVAPLVVSFQRIALGVTNAKNASGGDDPETLDHARIFAPITFKARDVAVVESDYYALPNTFADPLAGKVAKAKAVVVRSAQQDTLLNVLLSQASSVAAGSVPAVTTQTGIVKTKADEEIAKATAITTNAGIVNGHAAAVTAQTGDIATDLAAIKAFVTSISNHRDVIIAKTTTTTTESGLSDAAAAAIATAVTTIQSNPTLQVNNATIQAQLAIISAQKLVINNSNSLIATAQSVIASEANALNGTDASGINGLANDIDTANDSIIVSAAAIAPVNAVVVADAAVVTADANAQKTAADAALAAVVDPTSSLTAISSALYSHVDGMLSEMCKVNLIQVPILTRDVNGFLQGPSLALITSLQTFLDERKEATVTVEVLDGSPTLVLVDTTVKVSVLEGFVKQEVVSNVTTALETVLKDKDFGQALRIAEMYDATIGDALGGIPGLRYLNIKFDLTRNYLGVVLPGLITSDGDVVIAPEQIITKGVLAVSAL